MKQRRKKFTRKYNITLLIMFIFVAFSMVLAEIPPFSTLKISPLIIAVILGTIYSNSTRWIIYVSHRTDVLKISTKQILRLGIILYGFRLTFHQILEVGYKGFGIAVFIVFTTIALAILIGKKLKLDKKLAVLIGCGSGICGAAAVLAVESVVKAGSDRTVVAVATVVIFGTLGMFLFPIIYSFGIFPFDNLDMGILVGGVLHEVAHVVGAGAGINTQVQDVAVVVKMIRVLLLVVVLIVLGLFSKKITGEKGKQRVSVPQFALWFVAACVFNSLVELPKDVLKGIEFLDTILLSIAMVALGMNTHLKALQNVGKKPFILATILFFWLGFSGYAFVLLF